MANQSDPKELEKLGNALARSAIRKMFSIDPLNALTRAGIDTSKVSEETIDLLASLQPWELEVLGRVAETAKARGIADLAAADHVGVIIH